MCGCIYSTERSCHILFRARQYHIHAMHHRYIQVRGGGGCFKAIGLLSSLQPQLPLPQTRWYSEGRPPKAWQQALIHSRLHTIPMHTPDTGYHANVKISDLQLVTSFQKLCHVSAILGIMHRASHLQVI